MSCKRWVALTAAALLLVGMLCACQSKTEEQPPSTQSTLRPGEVPETVTTVTGVDVDEQFSDRDSEADYHDTQVMYVALKDGSTAGQGVSVKGDTITVVNAGTYVFSGSLSNGRLVVDAPKDAKIQLVFDGVSITCSSFGALYVKQADKVFLTLSEGSENILTTTAVSTAGVEENVDGTLFSKDDLTINGSGSLTVNSPDHGIVCKADLVVTDGHMAVSAAGHALQAKKSARIGGGTFALTAGKDGIHVENPDDTTEGYLYIEDGTFTVTAEGDGFSAATLLQVSGGKGSLICGGGAAAAPAHTGDMMGRPGWGQSSTTTTEDDTSSKGMKGGTSLLLSGGTWELDTADDGLHANGDLTMSGGTLTVATGDDGLHADGLTVITGGTLRVTESYEGIEGNAIEIGGGTISVVASDDGLNAAGGNDQSGFGGQPDQFSGDSSCYIRISGGKTVINAAGDGIDANYSLYVEGGETYVSGPTNSGNGALDYGSTGQVTGGILVAVGAQGMAQGFTSATNQGAMLVNIGNTTGELLLKDSDGDVLLRWTPEKTYASIALTCPGLVKGETYTLSVDGTEQQIEMTDWIFGSSGGMGGGMGGPGGGGPGGGGMRPPR